MRLYIDTNILVFMLEAPEDISRDTRHLLYDERNLVYVSTECVRELIHLSQIGKVHIDLRRTDLTRLLSDIGVEVVPVTLRHLQTLASLPMYDDHHDPSDRIIIAQAIADRATLITSDWKMERYRRDGLDFVFNKR